MTRPGSSLGSGSRVRFGISTCSKLGNLGELQIERQWDTVRDAITNGDAF